MKKIVMIDQDGVLVDQNYKPTIDTSFFSDLLSNDSLVIVPNSDTPITRLQQNFQTIMGIHPNTIVGERGATVLLDGNEQLMCSTDNISGFITSLIEAFKRLDCDIELGDSVTWIRNEKKFKPNRRMLIIDSERKSTVGFYLRCTDEMGVTKVDKRWFDFAIEIVKTLPIPQELISNDFNHDYGIVIMNARGVNKTTGYKLLKERMLNGVFFMIGDSDNDIINSNQVVHCAVANASNSLKKVSAFVADKPHTAGLLQCLQWITSR